MSIRWLLTLPMLAVLVLPFAADASSVTCECFCGTPTEGAKPITGANTAEQCIETCRDSGKEPVGCFTSDDQEPEKSGTCWTQEECQLDDADNVWEDDVSTCDDSKVAMGHCYAEPYSITTMVAIGGTNTFSSLPDYIDKVYRFAVPVMTIVAIVMVMVGGLQYILSRGNPGSVKQAKERMKQAVTGLVLLLSAFVLANLLDPRLVNFTQLRIPKIKQVSLLTDEMTCKYISALGFQIDNVDKASFADKACGTSGTVTDLSAVPSDVQTGVWEERDTCDYTLCETGQTCVSNGTTNSCVSCTDVNTTPGVTELVDAVTGNRLAPSETVCARMESLSESTSADQLYCMYDGYASGEAYIDAVYPACVSVSLECATLQSFIATLSAVTSIDGCPYYEAPSTWGVLVQRRVLMPASAVTIDGAYRLGDEEIFSDSDIYERVCEEDRCGLGKMTGKTCTFAEDAGGNFSCTGQ